MKVVGNEIILETEGLFDKGSHIEECNKFIFMIEDPQVRLDVSKRDYVDISDAYAIKVKNEYKYKRPVVYLVIRGEVNDHWIEVFTENGELKMIEYNRQKGFAEIVIGDERIIQNGIFYTLSRLNDFI